MITALHTVASLEKRAGGPSRTVPRLCEELSSYGVETFLATQERVFLKEKNVIPDSEKVRTVSVRAFGSDWLRLIYSPAFGSALRNICQKHHIQLIHDHGLWLPTNHAAAAASRKLEIPLIVSPRGMLEPWSLSFKAIKKKLAWNLYQNRNLKKARAFCATSEKESENIRRLGFKQPVAIIPNGVDFPFIPKTNKKISVQHTALFMSRLHPKKGLEILIEAWGKVRPAGWRLLIAGPDENAYGKIVQNSINTRGLENIVKMIGPVEGEHKWRLLRDSDLFFLPTFSENFGVVVAEALAAGTPVITTKATPWDGLVNHRCGWWIDIGVEPLAMAISEATVLPRKVLSEMGLKGQQYARDEFGWDAIADKMAGFYTWLLQGNPKPDWVRDN